MAQPPPLEKKLARMPMFLGLLISIKSWHETVAAVDDDEDDKFRTHNPVALLQLVMSDPQSPISTENYR